MKILEGFLEKVPVELPTGITVAVPGEVIERMFKVNHWEIFGGISGNNPKKSSKINIWKIFRKNPRRNFWG